jgi:hypothetical protein
VVVIAGSLSRRYARALLAATHGDHEKVGESCALAAVMKESRSCPTPGQPAIPGSTRSKAMDALMKRLRCRRPRTPSSACWSSATG